jgi:hypothetical protein
MSEESLKVAVRVRPFNDRFVIIAAFKASTMDAVRLRAICNALKLANNVTD